MLASANITLERLLRFDALLCTGMGLLLLLAGGPLGELFGLPVALLRAIGVGLQPWALVVWRLARGHEAAPRRAWIVIVGNAVWALASGVLLLRGWFDPSTPGALFIALQALAVAALAFAQARAIARSHDVRQPTIT